MKILNSTLRVLSAKFLYKSIINQQRHYSSFPELLAFSLFFKVVLFAFELDLNTIFSLGLALMPSAQSSLANILPSAFDFTICFPSSKKGVSQFYPVSAEL